MDIGKVRVAIELRLDCVWLGKFAREVSVIRHSIAAQSERP